MLLAFDRLQLPSRVYCYRRSVVFHCYPSAFSFLFTVRDEDRSTTKKSSDFDFALLNTRRVCCTTDIYRDDSSLSLTSAFPDTHF